jgi:excisionase family DNA binding protein
VSAFLSTARPALRLEDVAKRLACSRNSAWRLVTSGALRGFRLSARSAWRVDPSDLEAFVEARKGAISTAGDAAFDPDAALGPIPEKYRL